MKGRAFCGLRYQGDLGRRLEEAGVLFVALQVLQVDGHRVLPGVGFVDIADAMGGQVDLAILVIG